MKEYRQPTSWGYIDWLRSAAHDKNARADVGIVCLLPGKKQAEHTHYSETQFLYMLEGYGEHRINDECFSFKPGDHFFLPCGIRHSTNNLGKTPVRELMVSIPIHLMDTPKESLTDYRTTADDAFIRQTLLRGIEQLAIDTLDHLNFPLIITEENGTQIYGSCLSENCTGCRETECPIRGDSHELHLSKTRDSGSVVCPRGLTVLIQPIEIENRTWFFIKSGLFHEYPNIPRSDSVYDVPGSTVSSLRILLQDIARYLVDYCRARRIEQEITARDDAVAEEQLHSKVLTEAFEQSRNITLNTQIRNHFLFNALNSIASLAIRDNSTDTYEAILNLAELLRGLLRQEGTRVPLSEELAFLQRYISLQELRHEGSLEIIWKRSSSAERVIVPHNFLQPVVENTFQHAFKDSCGNKVLTIETNLFNNRAQVTIRDNGCGMDADQLAAVRGSLSSDSPHGLSMVYRKLAGVFGMDFSFEIDSTPGQGTVCRLQLPC